MVGEDKVPDISADFAVAKDRGESPAEMEPLLIGETSRFRGSLTDFAVELAQKAAAFRRSLPESLLKSLADLVRSMNCYYSNLIEGHYTHPIDIERALKNDYSKDASKRDLQLEAKAHVAVQKRIDEGGLKGRAVTTEGTSEFFGNKLDVTQEDLAPMLRQADAADIGRNGLDARDHGLPPRNVGRGEVRALPALVPAPRRFDVFAHGGAVESEEKVLVVAPSRA